MLNQKVEQAKVEGREFHWTGINNGTFFDWYVFMHVALGSSPNNAYRALHASFIDIALPPNKTVTYWDGGK